MKKQAEIKWRRLYRKVRWLQSIKQALRKMRNYKNVTTTYGERSTKPDQVG